MIEAEQNRIVLGAYELLTPLGRGGMAEVWRGRHIRQDVPVAIKVMTLDRARQQVHRQAFRNELRSVAGLDHPNIIRVYDYGEVPVEAQAASGFRLTPGNPYLVMELGDGGSLFRPGAPPSWQDTKAILLSVLDALAHAHARSVVHLDLKPDNILCIRSGHHLTYKLTDFGIAHAFERWELADPARARREPDTVPSLRAQTNIIGTPTFMAPEQFMGEWRDFGPWTDLYALGCLAWDLVTGQPPFVKQDSVLLAVAHWNEEPPPLTPRGPVPEGLEDWLLRLLEKRPARRFQRAADAAWALLQLTDPSQEPPAPTAAPLDLLSSLDESPSAPTVQVAPLHTLLFQPRLERPHPDSSGFFQASTLVLGDSEAWLLGDLSTGEQRRLQPTLHLAGPPRETPSSAPPLPPTWRQAVSPARSAPLMGAGLSIYGLRAIPLVDRLPERDLLWQELKEVAQSGRARAVLLEGTVGLGKSRLAEWLCTRAHEVGAATVLKAVHTPGGGPSHGLAPMVARHLRCTGMDPEDALGRVATLLQDEGENDPYELRTLTALALPALTVPADGSTPAEDDRPPAMRLEALTPLERYAALQRLLVRLSLERPVVMWLDDVQWSADTLEFVRYLLQLQVLTPTPVLMVLTAQSELLATRTLEREQLARLLTLPPVSRLALQPLAQRDHALLVERLLGLEPELAARVQASTAGNPMFAVQLVGDWVQRGVLEVVEEGFRLRDANLSIPASLQELWIGWLERLLEGQPAEFRQALGVAAALGYDFEEGEWRAACEVEGLDLPPGLLELLLTNRALQSLEAQGTGSGPAQTRWAFAHGVTRDGVETLSRQAGRWEFHHRACAAMLSRRTPLPPRGAGRLAHHCLEAGDWAQAVPALKQAVGELEQHSDFPAALLLLEQWERALRSLKVPEAALSWGELSLSRSALLLRQGRVEEARDAAARGEQGALTHGWEELLPGLRLARAEVAYKQGELGDAVKLAADALKRCKARQDARGVARCLTLLATCTRERGELERTPQLIQPARQLYQQLEDPLGEARCLLELGRHARVLRRWEESEAWYREALELCRRVDNPLGSADTLRALGRLAYDQLQLEEAADYFHRAQALFQRVGAQDGVADVLNDLAETDRRRGRLAEAEAGYRASLSLAESIGSGQGVFPRYNLGLLLLRRGEVEEARALLTRACQEAEQAGRRPLIYAVHGALLACVARGGDWSAWDGHFAQVAQLFHAESVDVDDAWPVQLAADQARGARELSRAAQAYTLALKLWQVLGRGERVREVQEALARCV